MNAKKPLPVSSGTGKGEGQRLIVEPSRAAQSWSAIDGTCSRRCGVHGIAPHPNPLPELTGRGVSGPNGVEVHSQGLQPTPFKVLIWPFFSGKRAVLTVRPARKINPGARMQQKTPVFPVFSTHEHLERGRLQPLEQRDEKPPRPGRAEVLIRSAGDPYRRPLRGGNAILVFLPGAQSPWLLTGAPSGAKKLPALRMNAKKTLPVSSPGGRDRSRLCRANAGHQRTALRIWLPAALGRRRWPRRLASRTPCHAVPDGPHGRQSAHGVELV
jgi:hypothetical protein